MNVLRRIAIAIGGTAIVALVLTLAVPRTAHAVFSALVTVTNTSANPVPNRDVDNSANFPFSSEVCFGDVTFCQGVTGQFTVPTVTSSGVPVKRLIIETISGVCESPSSDSNFIAGIALNTSAPTDSSNSPLETVFLPAVQTEPGFAMFNESVHFYAGPGASVVEGSTGASSSFLTGGCQAAVSGYLIAE